MLNVTHQGAAHDKASVHFRPSRPIRRTDILVIIISKRQRITLRLLYAIAIPSVVCRLSVCLSSVVCDVGAPYSAG